MKRYLILDLSAGVELASLVLWGNGNPICVKTRAEAETWAKELAAEYQILEVGG